MLFWNSHFGLGGVQLVDFLLELLLRDFPLELHSGGQLPSRLAEVYGQQGELLNVGGSGHRLLVGLLHALLDQLQHLGVFACVIGSLDVNACSLEKVDGVGGEIFGGQPRSHVNVHLEGDEGGHESLVLPHQHDVAAGWTGGLKVVLDGDWGHVFAARRDDQLLDSPRDLEESLGIQRSEVSAPEVSLGVDALLGRLLILEVAHHDVATLDPDLADARLIRVRNLDLAPSDLSPGHLGLVVMPVGHRGRAGRLAKSVHVHEGNIEGAEVLDGGLLEGSGAEHENEGLV
mmetsp:Transcript_18020/g.30698  ORF Transcript_18020/g.30698 Transcript_18020/m.30698 type:complete len:288 (-) Transcript_18020:1245-2108(-)